MADLIKAIRYRNLDEARQAWKTAAGSSATDIFDDAGEEPQGLLSVIPEDRVEEEGFVRLFDAKKGVLVEVERIPYSGYGPPADEEDYMGFISEQTAYVLKGRRLAIEIENCPNGARDFHHLDALILDNVHPIDRDHLARKLDLPEHWDFDLLFDMLSKGRFTAQELDSWIHQGIH
jgi:hypothetical protein